MQTYSTPTITRRTIKRVENRLNGVRLGGLSLPGYPSSTPPISSTSTNGSISWGDFLGFINGTLGQLKIDATQFAEGMVRVMYGLEPGCTMPQPGIPVVANNPTPKFCASSVAGLIERCRLYEAQNALTSVKTQFQQRMSNASDPAAPYITRWWNEYGQTDISTLTAIISAASGTCGVTGGIPKVCTSPMVWSASQLKCVYPTEGGTSGGSTTTIMLVGLAAIVAMAFLKR